MSGSELIILSLLLIPISIIFLAILDFIFQDRRNKWTILTSQQFLQ